MSDLGKNIQRIAETEELQRQINDLLSQVKDLKDKAGKNGDRSIAYQKRGGGGVAQKSTDKDAALVTNIVGQTIEDIKKAILDSFSTEAGNGETGEANTIEAFTANVDDLETTAPNLGTKIFKLEGIKEIGGTKEAYINLDNTYVPQVYELGVDQSTLDYGIDDDPRESFFEAGTFYDITGAGIKATSASSCFEQYAGWLNETQPDVPYYFLGVYDPAYGGATLATGTFSYYNKYTGETVEFLSQCNIRRGLCTIGVDPWCPATAPLDNLWGPNSVHQLAFDGAVYVTNALEALDDLANTWSGDPSVIKGETSAGTDVTIRPTDEGGSILTFQGGNELILAHDGTVISRNY